MRLKVKGGEMDFIPEVPKIFLTVGVAVWILTYFLGKVRIIAKYLKKEELAIIIGLIIIVAGIFSNYFTTEPFTTVIYGIIAIYITQSFHDKTVKPIIEHINNSKNGISIKNDKT